MLLDIVLGYVIFSIVCGSMLVMMIIGDRVYSSSDQGDQKDIVGCDGDAQTQGQSGNILESPFEEEQSPEMHHRLFAHTRSR